MLTVVSSQLWIRWIRRFTCFSVENILSDPSQAQVDQEGLRDLLIIPFLLQLSQATYGISMILILILNFHQTIQRFTIKYHKNKWRLRMFRLHEGPVWLGHNRRVNRRINCTVRSGKPATSVKEYKYSGLLLWPPLSK